MEQAHVSQVFFFFYEHNTCSAYYLPRANAAPPAAGNYVTSFLTLLKEEAPLLSPDLLNRGPQEVL